MDHLIKYLLIKIFKNNNSLPGHISCVSSW
jgi:hypothetical protein